MNDSDYTAYTDLLACDLDGTVIPLEEGGGHDRGVEEFRAAVGLREGLLLAYVTGRHLDHAMEGIRRVGLPEPAYLACEVGTALYQRGPDRYVPDAAYARIMAQALGTEMARVREATASFHELEPQPQGQQGDFKASFFAPWPVKEPLLDGLREALDDAGADTDFIVSRDVHSGRGLLDVLPRGVAKDRAVRHIMERAGLVPDHVVFAGDSGNDRAAILSGVRAVVVGNAGDDLRDGLRREAELRGLVDRIHFAEAPYAAGVVEGCRHFGVF
ncbi:MAG: HAD-IIB family hydrolase [Gemmatimonadota bacterium]|jgi:HAD superfamily hydrolase (TIGR01484 family)